MRMAHLSRACRIAKGTSFVSGTSAAFTALPIRLCARLEGSHALDHRRLLIVLWLLGVVVHVGGGLIHLLLVIAVIVGLVQLFTGRRV